MPEIAKRTSRTGPLRRLRSNPGRLLSPRQRATNEDIHDAAMKYREPLKPQALQDPGGQLSTGKTGSEEGVARQRASRAGCSRGPGVSWRKALFAGNSRCGRLTSLELHSYTRSGPDGRCRAARDREEPRAPPPGKPWAPHPVPGEGSEPTLAPSTGLQQTKGKEERCIARHARPKYRPRKVYGTSRRGK